MSPRYIRDETGDVDRERTWKFEERRLRRRQVYALELLAFARFCGPETGEWQAVRNTAAFQALTKRLTGGS